MSNFKIYYVITMWSGGKAAKKWVSDQEPELLPSGSGISFYNMKSKLNVKMIGSISVETYESGREAMEAVVGGEEGDSPKPAMESVDRGGKDRLF